MKRFSILFIIIALLTTCVYAAGDVKFTVKAPGRVYEGDKFPVTFRLSNAEGSDLKVSAIDGCTLLFGPSTSTSQSYSVVNGHAESSSAVEYTYYYRGRQGRAKIHHTGCINHSRRQAAHHSDRNPHNP